MSDPLTTAALLGTSRSGGLPEASHALLELPWSALAGQGDPSRSLLAAAALEATARRAGLEPVTGVSLPEPAPEESRPVMSPGTAQALERIALGEFPQSLPEWIALAAQAGVVAPARLLPLLFDLGSKQRRHRPGIRSIAGSRGLWLAAQNPRWSWVVEEAAVPDEAWDTGSQAERLAWLRQVRASDPARAAEAIAAEWKNESPDMREGVAQLAAEAPHPVDESWLEALALPDRRQGTRQAAARALILLENSAFRRRALERARPLLRIEGRLKKTLTLAPPETFDPDWARDGLKESPPKGTGARAWWARQLIAQLPLSDWCTLLGVTGRDLFKIRLDPDWSEPIVTGWLDAVIQHPDPALLPGFLALVLRLQEKEKLPALRSLHTSIPTILEGLSGPQRADVLESLKGREDLVRSLLVRFQPPLQSAQHPALTKLVTSWWRDKQHGLSRPEAVALAFCSDPATLDQQLQAIAALPELSAALEEYARALEFRQSYLRNLLSPS